MRSAMVPVVQFGSRFSQWILFAGLILWSSASIFGQWLLLAGIALFALTTLFAFITLPVEYNASNRALVWLNNTGISTGKENEYAKDSLKWAARTYVVAALASLATLLYYISLLTRRN
jgi:Zn-dependent membrane protease YugP